MTLAKRSTRTARARRIPRFTSIAERRVDLVGKLHQRRPIAVVHPPEGLPEGQLIHAAGQSADEWVVIALWDSRESWERFRNETLLPGLQQAEGAFSGPPEESAFAIANFKTG